MNINWTTIKTMVINLTNNVYNFNWIEWFYLPVSKREQEDLENTSLKSESTDSFKSISSNDSDNSNNLFYDASNNDSGYNSPIDLISENRSNSFISNDSSIDLMLENTSNSFIPLVVIGVYSKLKNIGLITFIPRILTILITRITINILMLIILAIILYALGYFDEPSGVFYIDQTVLLILHIYKLFISLLLKIANFLCFYIIKVINLLEWIWKWRNF